MFKYSKFTGKHGDISNWDVSNVTSMTEMFFKCKFNGDLSKWDVSNVERFNEMFGHSAFSGDISKWKINSNAKGNMLAMFRNSPLENTPPDWYYKYS